MERPSRNDPEWVEPAHGLAAAVDGCRAAAFGALLIDTPSPLSDTIAEVLALADLILVPVPPSPNDLRAVGRTVELTAASGKPMVFVVNRATARARITTQAVIELSPYGAVSRIVIHARMDFTTNMTDGRTGRTEYIFSTLWGQQPIAAGYPSYVFLLGTINGCTCSTTG